MAVTVENLQATADQLAEALDAYGRFLEEWPYESGGVPAGVREYLADRGESSSEVDVSLGEALADTVVTLYYEAREAEAVYVQQAREQGRSDWAGVVAETDPVRDAARRVHTAGYGADPETGERGYLLPEELCPAPVCR